MLKKCIFAFLVMLFCLTLAGGADVVPFKEVIVSDYAGLTVTEIKFVDPFKDQHTRAIGEVYVLVNITCIKTENLTAKSKRNFPQGRLYYIGMYSGWQSYTAMQEEAENTLQHVIHNIARVKGWTGAPPSYTKKREPKNLNVFPKKKEFESKFGRTFEEKSGKWLLFEVEAEFYP